MDKQKLFKAWILTVLALQIALFYELVAVFDLSSVLYWIRAAAVLALLVFTFCIIYSYRNDGHDKKYRWYADELKKRDARIEELEKENDIIVRASLKQSEQAVKWNEYAKQLEKKLK